MSNKLTIFALVINKKKLKSMRTIYFKSGNKLEITQEIFEMIAKNILSENGAKQMQVFEHYKNGLIMIIDISGIDCII